MPVFAITGVYSSGKTVLLNFLKRKGAVVFDADKRIHGYYRDKGHRVYKRVSESFPQSVRGGRICRKSLGKIVFKDIGQLRRLERIVHPEIIKDLLSWVKECRGKEGVFVAEVPLLFEKGLDKHFDGVILVKVKKQTAAERIIKANGCSKDEALSRLALFAPLGAKIKKADYIIDNDSGKKEFRVLAEALWNKLIG